MKLITHIEDYRRKGQVVFFGDTLFEVVRLDSLC